MLGEATDAADLGGRPRGLGVTTAEEDATDAADVSASRFLGGRPLFLGAGATEAEAVESSARLDADLGGRPRRLGCSEKETLALGLVSVRLPGVERMDLGGRPRGRVERAEVEA